MTTETITTSRKSRSKSEKQTIQWDQMKEFLIDAAYFIGGIAFLTGFILLSISWISG